MDPEIKEYIDQQINWVRDLKKIENAWIEKYLEEQIQTQEQMRKEMRGMAIAFLTILMTGIGLLIAFYKK